MSEKEKPKPPQSKNIPKDGQVIMSIMKEMGIAEYEPKTLVQLTEFVYRYVTSVLEEARAYANSKKKFLELDDVHLALELSRESSFTTPPPREVVMECARNKNNNPLPLVKPHFGLRLPPDRHCLSSCNYTLRNSSQKKRPSYMGSVGTPSLKLSNKPGLSYIKRSNTMGISKQTVSATKPLTKITTNASGLQLQKTVVKPKIQVTQNLQVQQVLTDSAMEVDSGFKRKREDDSESM